MAESYQDVEIDDDLEGAEIIRQVFSILYDTQPDFLLEPRWKPIEDRGMAYLRDKYPKLEQRDIEAEQARILSP